MNEIVEKEHATAGTSNERNLDILRFHKHIQGQRQGCVFCTFVLVVTWSTRQEMKDSGGGHSFEAGKQVSSFIKR